MAEFGGNPLMPHMRLDVLLAELQVRLNAVPATRDRVHALLEAVVSVGSDLDLETVLRRIVRTATTLVDASYGALGVVGQDNTLLEFIPVGLSEEEIARIEHWPHGLGLLGLLIKDARRDHHQPAVRRRPTRGAHPDGSAFGGRARGARRPGGDQTLGPAAVQRSRPKDAAGLRRPSGHRSGLRNIEERAAQLGGSAKLDVPRQGGTRLTWTVPI